MNAIKLKLIGSSCPRAYPLRLPHDDCQSCISFSLSHKLRLISTSLTNRICSRTILTSVYNRQRAAAVEVILHFYICGIKNAARVHILLWACHQKSICCRRSLIARIECTIWREHTEIELVMRWRGEQKWTGLPRAAKCCKYLIKVQLAAGWV